MTSMVPAAERPALCTTPSMRPQRATAASTNASRSSARATSARCAEHVAARLAQRRLGGAQTLLVPAADGDRRPLGRQPRGQREAEPVGAARDEHDLAGQFEIHGHSSFVGGSGGAHAGQEPVCLRLRAQADEAQAAPSAGPRSASA